ncbi:hypothetical protein PV328_004200 [Microctonus aethiopoides]|uniref:Uncharacterized protein n=1 Tax=Microctonus aethiopoides TaxID=144406 RepID=A0AA39KLG0_9HYME|nr:hypothetical protein PV328_004200 [Microctonus aethiopoides]
MANKIQELRKHKTENETKNNIKRIIHTSSPHISYANIVKNNNPSPIAQEARENKWINTQTNIAHQYRPRESSTTRQSTYPSTNSQNTQEHLSYNELLSLLNDFKNETEKTIIDNINKLQLQISSNTQLIKDLMDKTNYNRRHG